MSTSILASYFILISKHKQLQVSQSGTWQVQAQSHLEHFVSHGGAVQHPLRNLSFLSTADTQLCSKCSPHCEWGHWLPSSQTLSIHHVITDNI